MNGWVSMRLLDSLHSEMFFQSMDSRKRLRDKAVVYIPRLLQIWRRQKRMFHTACTQYRAAESMRPKGGSPESNCRWWTLDRAYRMTNIAAGKFGRIALCPSLALLHSCPLSQSPTDFFQDISENRSFSGERWSLVHWGHWQLRKVSIGPDRHVASRPRWRNGAKTPIETCMIHSRPRKYSSWAAVTAVVSLQTIACLQHKSGIRWLGLSIPLDTWVVCLLHKRTGIMLCYQRRTGNTTGNVMFTPGVHPFCFVKVLLAVPKSTLWQSYAPLIVALTDC